MEGVCLVGWLGRTCDAEGALSCYSYGWHAVQGLSLVKSLATSMTKATLSVSTTLTSNVDKKMSFITPLQ